MKGKTFSIFWLILVTLLTSVARPSQAKHLGVPLQQGCPDPYEPNDGFGKDAWPLSPGTVKSYICTSSDVDYFGFSVQARQQIQLDLYNLPEDYNLCLYDPRRNLIRCSSNGGQADESITHIARTSGTYYAYVYGAKGAYNESNPYILSLQVQGLPDLSITDVWEDNGQICYQIWNSGRTEALRGYINVLSIDGQPLAEDEPGDGLAVGERLNRCFGSSWQCSGLDDEIAVCADVKDAIVESDENNNCREETVLCDQIPPEIVAGPSVKVEETATTVTWQTDEKCLGVVEYGPQAGVFAAQIQDLEGSQEHELVLEPLEPATVYHYVAQCADASGNTAAADDAFFQTDPPALGQPPEVAMPTVTRDEGEAERYTISVPVSDTFGVERVEFYLDGELIGIDYSPDPLPAVGGSAPQDVSSGLYSCVLDPAKRKLPRTTFFSTSHALATQAFGWSGLSALKEIQYVPPYELPDIELTVEPMVEQYRYVDAPGDTLPAGSAISLDIEAYEEEWWCSYVVADCHDVQLIVDRVVFSLDDTPVHTWDPGTDEFNYTYDWNIGGLGVGDYTMHVKAYAAELTHVASVRSFGLHVEVGTPSLDVSREVIREGNLFRVRLTLENEGTATAHATSIVDRVTGFQPVTTETESYEVSADCHSDTDYCHVDIDLFTDTDDFVSLDPGESLVVEYHAVPILHPDLDTFEFGIGEPLNIWIYDRDDVLNWSFDRPAEFVADGDLLAEAVGHALEEADYLIVTYPSRLFWHYTDADVNELLSSMASLGMERSGVLGYLDSYNRYVFKDLIEPGGDWSSRLTTDWTSEGYLLIVGETEIVPSLDIYDRDIRDATSSWSGGSVFPVPLIDNYYADISGDDHLPELIVGRIVGDSPDQLMTPIQISLLDQFERTDALVISGIGTGQDSFENNADEVADILDDEFTVNQMYGSDYTSDAQRLTQFTNRAQDKDVLYFRDHGSINAWSHTVDTGDFPVNFGDSRPLAFGMACLTGNYEDASGDDYSIAEAFLDSDAGVYIGATEASSRSRNNKAGKTFFEKWVNTSRSLGQALKETKRELDVTDDRYRLWVMEYNLYGDPKYGASSAASTNSASIAQEASQPPLSSLEVTIPDYEVTTRAGLDYVEIPGGQSLLVSDKPMVPFYVVSVDYAKGYKVQDVVLTKRSGLVTAAGLNLPTVVTGQGGDGGQKPETLAELTNSGWYPEEEYRWQIVENPDGSTTLRIMMYPFYYNPSTTNVKFYKDYRFDIDYAVSSVAIANLTTDEDVYQQGDKVMLSIELNNQGDSQDVIFSALMKRYGSGEIVDGLLLRSLDDFLGEASFSPQWDSGGFEPGYYYVEVTLKDTGGNVLDRETERFRLGISSGEITSFAATPQHFDIGDSINISLVFSNSGTIDISGTAVIRVRDEAAETVQEYRHDVTDLTSGKAISFDDVWDTSGAEEGTYNIVGYVLYDGMATDPMTAVVSTETRIYLPLVLRE